MIAGLRQLADCLPEAARPFTHTAFPFPVSQALYGAAPDVESLRRQAAELDALIPAGRRRPTLAEITLRRHKL